MRRIACVMLMACLVALLVAPAAGAQGAAIRIMINGKLQSFEQAPFIENGRTLVPLRAIFEALSAQVQWDDATKTVTATRGDRTVQLTIGQAEATVSGQTVQLDVPALIRDGRTFVPLRFVSEALGAGVDWDGHAKTVIIVDLNYLRSGGADPAATALLQKAMLYKGPYNGDLTALVQLGPAGRDPLIAMEVAGQARNQDAYFKMEQTIVFGGRPITGTAELAARGGKVYLKKVGETAWKEVGGPVSLDRLGTPGGIDPTRLFANPLAAGLGGVTAGSPVTYDGAEHRELTVTIDPVRAREYFDSLARGFGTSLAGVTFQEMQARMLVRTGDGFPRNMSLSVKWMVTENGATYAYQLTAAANWTAASGPVLFPATLP